jgi:hypothetical protein
MKFPGKKNYFNYREFCRVCDPPSADLQLAEKQNLAPYQKHQASKRILLSAEQNLAPYQKH